MGRYLSEYFDAVHVAMSSEEAEAILNDQSARPTHLICGQDLGPYCDSGATLIPAWRKLCPSLICVVLATGALQLPAELPGVDAVFLKPAQPSQLLSLVAA